MVDWQELIVIIHDLKQDTFFASFAYFCGCVWRVR